MATTTMAIGEKVGFWRRTGAYIIDAILLAIVNNVITNAAYPGDLTAGSGVNLVVGLLYFGGLWTYWNGQTIGMKVLGIKVVRTDGAALTLTTSLIRYLMLIVSFLVFFIGVIWVAFDANKQGWHDKVANTYVVNA